MKYSFNQDKEGVVFANMKDINASFKDLSAVCDAVRYRSIKDAMDILNAVSAGEMPILYRTHNASMGSRHELGGKKGRTPMKCAAIVRKVLVNAAANAENKGFDTESMFVIHAAANKTMIASRRPSKGALFVSGGPSGYMTARRSDLEFARVEMGVSMMDEKKLSKNIIRWIKKRQKEQKRVKPKEKAKPILKKGILTRTPDDQKHKDELASHPETRQEDRHHEVKEQQEKAKEHQEAHHQAKEARDAKQQPNEQGKANTGV
jgi:large subunit ribosomal protein L22